MLLALAGAAPAQDFPYDHELILDARPMRPAKRMPMLTVAPSGNATIDLWCKTVSGRVELSGGAIRIETAPLPEEMPAMMSDGQCTPERMQADADLLAALGQVTAWRKRGTALTLTGATTLRFRASDH
jgi:heat shock protein HslJ